MEKTKNKRKIEKKKGKEPSQKDKKDEAGNGYLKNVLIERWGKTKDEKITQKEQKKFTPSFTIEKCY